MSNVLDCSSVPVIPDVAGYSSSMIHVGYSHQHQHHLSSNPYSPPYWYCTPGYSVETSTTTPLQHVCTLPVVSPQNNTAADQTTTTNAHSHLQITSPISSSVSIHTQSTTSNHTTKTNSTKTSPVIAPCAPLPPVLPENCGGPVLTVENLTLGLGLEGGQQPVTYQQQHLGQVQVGGLTGGLTGLGAGDQNLSLVLGKNNNSTTPLSKKTSGRSGTDSSDSSSNERSRFHGPDIFSPFMRGRIESLKRRYQRVNLDEQMVIHLLSFLVSRSSQLSGFTTTFTVHTVHNSLLEIFEVVLPEFNLQVTSRIFNPAVAALERIVVLQPKFLDVKTFKVFEQAYGRIKQLPNAHADSAYMRLLFLFGDRLPSFNLGPSYTENGSVLAMRFLVDRDKRYKKGSHNRKFFYLLCQAVLDHRS